VGGATALVGRRILEAVFGDQAVRKLVRAASKDLQRRIETELWTPERQRYLDILDDRAVPEGAADQLLTLSREVDDTQWLREQI
jgi:hypothetical protein